MAGGVALGVGMLSSSRRLSGGAVSVVASLTTTAPVINVVLSTIFFRAADPVTFPVVLGTVIVVAGRR